MTQIVTQVHVDAHSVSGKGREAKALFSCCNLKSLWIGMKYKFSGLLTK